MEYLHRLVSFPEVNLRVVAEVSDALLFNDGWICAEMPLDTVQSGEPIAAAKFKKIGNLRKLPNKLLMRRGITMDSGAGTNVIPKRMVNSKRIKPSAGSLRGLCFVAANDGKIPNEGEVELEFDTLEGANENWTFQVADANKPLGAVADRVDHRCRVVFDKDDETGQDLSYIYNKATRKITKMRREGNVWKVDAIVTPDMIMSDEEQVFIRQG